MAQNPKQKSRPTRDPGASDNSEYSWLLTYSDMITLLLAFFAVLIGISQVDVNLFNQFKEGLRSEVTGKETVRTPLGEIKKDLDSLLADQRKAGTVNINNTNRGLKLQFQSRSFYNSGEAQMLPSGRQIIDLVLQALQELGFYGFHIAVEGHTDDVPIQTEKFPSNWELSVSRASNVVKYFINQGIDAGRLQASGYADTKPLVPNRDSLGNPIEENRAQNRRITLRIYYPIREE